MLSGLKFFGNFNVGRRRYRARRPHLSVLQYDNVSPVGQCNAGTHAVTRYRVNRADLFVVTVRLIVSSGKPANVLMYSCTVNSIGWEEICGLWRPSYTPLRCHFKNRIFKASQKASFNNIFLFNFTNHYITNIKILIR